MPGKVDDYERERALSALDAHGDTIERVHRKRDALMRSSPERKKSKETQAEGVPMSERTRRIRILLRSKAYDVNQVERMPDVIEVPTSWPRSGKSATENETIDTIPVRKEEILAWLQALAPHERQRLYTMGRRKLDFVFRESDYPHLVPSPLDTAQERAVKKEGMERMRLFQEQQKRLADALEVVAVPMIRASLDALGKNTYVYLASSNDDIAGGVDIVVDMLDDAGNPKYFKDGTPMRFVVDVTYARMRSKIEIDVRRGRISRKAYAILGGNIAALDKPPERTPFGSLVTEVDPVLSNARTMKLFRSMVETLGGTMSILTSDSHGSLQEPQRHIPRLILGLDWGNAFAAISNWIEKGDEFEPWFTDTQYAQVMGYAIQRQMQGLRSLVARSWGNPNAPYLQSLSAELGLPDTEKGEGLKNARYDRSLKSLSSLADRQFGDWNENEADRLYRAAQAQVAHEAHGGVHKRGDGVKS